MMGVRRAPPARHPRVRPTIHSVRRGRARAGGETRRVGAHAAPPGVGSRAGERERFVGAGDHEDVGVQCDSVDDLRNRPSGHAGWGNANAAVRRALLPERRTRETHARLPRSQSATTLACHLAFACACLP